MIDYRTLTEVRHARATDERCLLCDDLGRKTAPRYQVGGEAYCEEHAAVMLSIGIARVLARCLAKELAA